MRDSNGELIAAGDRVVCSYGIPPVRMVAEIIERDGELIALTPGHKPPEAKLRTLVRHVGDVYKED